MKIIELIYYNFCLFWQNFEAIWEYYIVCIAWTEYKCVGRAVKTLPRLIIGGEELEKKLNYIFSEMRQFDKFKFLS